MSFNELLGQLLQDIDSSGVPFDIAKFREDAYMAGITVDDEVYTMIEAKTLVDTLEQTLKHIKGENLTLEQVRKALGEIQNQRTDA